jgi:ribonuclease D
MDQMTEQHLITSHETLVARSADELAYAYGALAGSANLGCDTETAGFSSRQCKLLSVQISNGSFSVLVPVCDVGVTLGPLASLLASSDHLKIFHNAKFDLSFLNDAGYPVRRIYDSMIAEKLITRGADQSAALSETIYRYFGVDLDKSQRQMFSSKRWDGRWRPELVAYALSDVVYLPELKQQQEPWLERLGLLKEFNIKMLKLMPG